MKLPRHDAYMRRRAARRTGTGAVTPEPDEAPLALIPKITERPAETKPLILETSVRQQPEPEQVEGAKATPAGQPLLWPKLRHVALDARHLTRNRLISATREDPAHVAFDVLRTKLLATLRANGWHRVAITSPTPDCGKSFVAANLAISLSRQASVHTMLMDLDLRRPSLARTLGVSAPGPIASFLTGDATIEQQFLRPAENALNIGDTLALGLNDRVETYAAELLQSPRTAEVLDDLYARLRPDVVLFDLPPALYYDDVLGFRPQFDGVLLVIGGGHSTAQEVRDVKRRFGADTPLLGVVLNRAEDGDIARYGY
ncbi:CpsD/CapB family tyrosine-protein kinase [uncultured Roseovarius sp.]|uniref:CpsD/CapB family tyrosine-protein kinase n=1 Tax=Roseovarius sp. TaxID=1486281 RepID=UPI0025FDFAFA|nr:CpsD/CapB family tyrosine-protein kinase [uncultured Roseovarius sp.]